MRVGIGIGLNYQRPTGGGAAPPSLVLDSLSAGAAYSTRLLRTAYGVSSPCIRVRRSNDNVEADIPFKLYATRVYPYWLDEDALAAHVGLVSGFIATVYDQSGNARHITQTDTTKQWRIVNSGTIDKLENVPIWVNPSAAFADFILGSNSSPFLYAAGQMTALFVLNQTAANASRAAFTEGRSTLNNPTYLFGSGGAVATTAAGLVRNDANTTVLNNATDLQTLVFSSTRTAFAIRDSGSAATSFKDGTAGTPVAYTRSGALTLDRFAVGGSVRTTAANAWPGNIAEAIFVTTAMTDTAITNFQTEQNTAFLAASNPP